MPRKLSIIEGLLPNRMEGAFLAPKNKQMSSFKVVLSIFAASTVALFSTNLLAQEIKGNAAAAGSKTAMCIGCHGIPGYKASYPNVYSVPKIGGQSEKYLVNALNAYKKGERNHPSMKGIAWSLSDQDIADLAAYYAAGVSVPVVKPAAK
jgi:cytochrome c553